MIAIGARSVGSLEPVAKELKAAATAAGRDGDALRVICVPIEVSVPASVEAAAELVRRELPGGLDIVVCNAGVSGDFVGILEADPDDWWRVYEVNVRGQFLLARYFLPLLLARRDGGLKTFVTVSSVGAHLTVPKSSQYQPGKMVNLRLAEFVDAEFASQGVSAWCVHPGNVATDMVGDMTGDIVRSVRESKLPDFFCIFFFLLLLFSFSLFFFLLFSPY